MTSKSYKPDDDQIAGEIAKDWREEHAYFHGQWHRYEAGLWETQVDQQIRQGVRATLRSYRTRGIKVSHRQISSVAHLLEDDCYVPDKDISAQVAGQRERIPLKNGVFNLCTGQLEPHSREAYYTTQLDFDYDPGAKCPMFNQFLKTSLVLPGMTNPDHSMVALLMEALAYSLTARVDMKASFWLVGERDSGKSTLLAFIKALLGGFAATIDLNQMGQNRFMLSEVIGKRVVAFTEADTGAFIPDALYKAVTGGQDTIWADVKNRPGISFVPTFKLWWAMNAAPGMFDRSGATLRRLHVILFNRTIPESERNLNLPALLEAERPGVFNHLLIFYRNLMKRGAFTLPKQSAAWKLDYQQRNDPEMSFLHECYTYDPKSMLKSSALYERYREWCDENGHKPKARNRVSEDWKRLGLQPIERNDGHYWQGINARQVES